MQSLAVVSTIMGYAGITGANDLQSHSDPYFHFHSIATMNQFVQGTSCATTTGSDNNAPTISAGNNYTIPVGTAYELRASATDP